MSGWVRECEREAEDAAAAAELAEEHRAQGRLEGVRLALFALDAVHVGRMSTWRRCVDAVRAVAGLPPLTDAEAAAHQSRQDEKPAPEPRPGEPWWAE